MQCVAVRCSVAVLVDSSLLAVRVYVAVCYSVLQCVAVRCSVLQYAAVCCSVFQCVAVCVDSPLLAARVCISHCIRYNTLQLYK